MHLGIDFLTILVDFGSQVGRQNRLKIDPKRHRKNDENKKASKMANMTLPEPTSVRETPRLDPGRGGRGRGKPFPGEVLTCLTTSAQRAGGIPRHKIET